ncbi:unnamed protein product [Caenorhabditis angaria]|uniref:Uncharacterized protein n=1 Tax=Caenorhabditis angaria TaxID=860376 RepID=A0A9P1IE83_9PELO|nr:unnamed protein product [Caenorhabditis angaria]
MFASLTGISAKFLVVIYGIFYGQKWLELEEDQFYLMLNVFWNFDSAFFPWFFLAKHQPLLKFFGFSKKKSESVINVVENQNDYFKNLQMTWG